MSACLYHQDQKTFDYYQRSGHDCGCDKCAYFLRRIKAKRHVKKTTYNDPLFTRSLKYAGKQFDGITANVVTAHICTFHKENDGRWHCSCGRMMEYL